MLAHPAVAFAAVIGATLVVLGALAGIVFLAYNGKGTEAIGALLLGVLGLVLGRLRKIDHQTNGTTSRLLDAALAPTVQSGASTSDVSDVDVTQTLPRQRIPAPSTSDMSTMG